MTFILLGQKGLVLLLLIAQQILTANAAQVLYLKQQATTEKLYS